MENLGNRQRIFLTIQKNRGFLMICSIQLKQKSALETMFMNFKLWKGKKSMFDHLSFYLIVKKSRASDTGLA